MRILIISGSFLLSLVAGMVLFTGFGRNASLGSYQELDWRALGQMDYMRGEVPRALATHDGGEIKIPGFMVPLEDDLRAVTEFLLVPNPMACIHVPPPPPNQMVMVRMRAGRSVPVQYGPIWVAGRFDIVTKKSVFGDSAFEMIGEHVVDYR